jgi:putative two-component system response regulator
MQERAVGYIYLEGVAGLGISDRHLIRVLANQVSAALHNLSLQEDLKEANAQALSMLAEASEFKDEDTGAHLQRMRRGTILLALGCGVDPDTATRFGEAAILHDVGKMGIPDHILQKPARLDSEEYSQIRRHTVIGESILGRSRWLQLSRDCALTHHEHWDGAGYPQGLRGEQIPLIGRIVAVMDVFDALAHRRPYKDAWPLDDVVEEIRQGSGRQFDPLVIDAFLSLHAAGRLDELV